MHVPRDFRLELLKLVSSARWRSPAIVDADGREWSDAALFGLAAAIQTALVPYVRPAEGALPIVVVCLDRGALAVATMVSVMDARAVYCPVDVAQPTERLRFVLAEARPCVIITDMKRAPKLLEHSSAPLLLVDRIVQDGNANDCSEANVDSATGPAIHTTPAYLLYTSGSSGTPKGVLGTYRGLLNRITWMQRTYPFSRDELVCLRTPLTFVDSLCEILSPLAHGVPAVAMSEDANRDTDALLGAIARRGVTRITLVPTLLQMILESRFADTALTSVRVCAVSGEVLPKDIALEFVRRFPRCHLLNFYGSTEVAADATWHEVTELDAERPSIPIGKPLSDVDVRVLREDGSESAAGEVGELVVFSDAAVADGFIHDTNVEASSFFENTSFPAVPHVRAWRTGDRGYQDGGLLFYAGRADATYKLAGRKVSPFSIEQLDSRVTALVCPVNGVNKLVGLVNGVADHDFPAWSHAFAAAARATLPDYMIPRLFHVVDRKPLNRNGKVDRSAIALDGVRFRTAARGGRRPNEIERAISEIVVDALRIGSIDVDGNLFEMGLTSIEVPALVMSLNRHFGRQVSLAEVYACPSVAGLAQTVMVDIGPAGAVVPIGGQSRNALPMFLVHPAGGLSFVYHELANMVPGCNLYGLSSPFFGLADKPYSTIAGLAKCYVETVRGAGGPIVLAGWSFGGEVAFEMTAQLESLGTPPLLLILIDSTRSNELPPDSNAAARRLYFIRNGIDPSSSFAETMLAEMQLHDRLSLEYNPAPLTKTPVVLLKASISSSADPHNGWYDLCAAGIRVVPVAGEHDYLVSAWQVEALARGLRDAVQGCR